MLHRHNQFIGHLNHHRLSSNCQSLGCLSALQLKQLGTIRVFWDLNYCILFQLILCLEINIWKFLKCYFRSLFERAGDVDFVQLSDGGRCDVEFFNDNSLNTAIQRFDRYVLDGHEIRVFRGRWISLTASVFYFWDFFQQKSDIKKIRYQNFKQNFFLLKIFVYLLKS